MNEMLNLLHEIALNASTEPWGGVNCQLFTETFTPELMVAIIDALIIASRNTHNDILVELGHIKTIMEEESNDELSKKLPQL